MILLGLAKPIHLNKSFLVPFLLLINFYLIGYGSTSSQFNSDNYHRRLNRRSISTFVKENDDGTRQNVILVQSDNKDELIQELSKHLNHTNKLIESSESSSALHDEHMEEEEGGDLGDSDVSEERNPEDLINSALLPVKLDDAEEQRPPEEVVSMIEKTFNSRQSFSCQKAKADFVTGTSTADLSPEDIGIIGAMGDALATGAGLWPKTDIEFRGAAFPIGGDATIDGLVTVPNILREFIPSNHLFGVSHGMGQRDQLSELQLNVAMSGAESSSMPDQASELVRRVKQLKEIDTWNTWAMLIVTIGTEEICKQCKGPNVPALIEALDTLNRGFHKALVILVGPIHVSSTFDQRQNLLKNRCNCSRNESAEFMEDLSAKWVRGFEQIADHMEKTKRQTFNALALPMLTVHSRYPYSLFIPDKPLLNRRGHNYAAKWLWNRLIGGPKYNLSSAILSRDNYFCPASGCPYFRTPDNFNLCQILTHSEANWRKEQWGEDGGAAYSRQMDLYLTTLVIVGIALVMVLMLGTFFYQRSKKGSKGRFDVVLPHGPAASYRKTTMRNPATENSSIRNRSNGGANLMGKSSHSQHQQTALMGEGEGDGREQDAIDGDGVDSSNAAITTDDSS